jgi:N-acetyl sugar amidotransferase
MNKGYQICKRCVMNTTDPFITFSDEGYCNHCTEFLQRKDKHYYKGNYTDKEFEKIINKIKQSGKGKQYDCVIGVSGGVDSSYVAYVAQKAGLRVLLAHLDNGWDSEQAALNIKNVAQILGMDYESFVLDWEEFKDLQLSFLRASVPEAETPTDIAIPAALHRIAAKHGIKYIINGGNFATEGILPKCWHYNARDITYLKHIQRAFGTKQIRKFPLFGYKQELYYKMVKGIKIIYLLNYTDYSLTSAMTLLKDKLMWKNYGGKHYESKYTRFIQSYYLLFKFAIDYRRATLSTQICTGTTTREIALKELETKCHDDATVEADKEYIAKKLGISFEELEKIIQLPPKLYNQYPNAEKRLGFIYDTYRRIFKKDKLSNF